MLGIQSTPFEVLAVIMIVMSAGFMFSMLTDIISWFAHVIAKWD